MTDAERLETPKQLAARVGITVRQVRGLIATRKLEHVMIGSRVHIPVGAFGRYLEASKVKPCHDETKARDCAGSTSGNAITSSGLSMVAAASARQVRETVKQLKISLQNGCSEGANEMAHVIHLRS